MSHLFTGEVQGAPPSPSPPVIQPWADKLQLIWRTSGQGISYEVDYSLASDEVVIGTLKTTALGCTIPGLRPETRYLIQLYACNASGRSPGTESWSTTLAGKILPPVPTQFVAKPAKDAVQLSWRGSSQDTGYKVSYGVLPNGPVLKSSTTTSVTCNVTGLNSNTEYYFDVRASNSVGDSAPVRITAKTLLVPPAPTQLKASATASTLQVTWASVVGATDYVVRYGIEPKGAVSTVIAPAGGCTLSALNRNTLYFVEVSARSSNGESPSARVTCKTLEGPAIPSTPRIAAAIVTFDTLTLAWTTSGARANYEVAWGVDDDVGAVIGRQQTTGLGMTLRHLAFATRYFFEVRAFNESGQSPPAEVQKTIGPDQTQPRNLRVPGQTCFGVQLVWEAPLDTSYLTGYEVICLGLLPLQVTTRECTVTGLRPQVDYHFKVQPRRSAGANPALAQSITVRTVDQEPPTRPHHLELSTVSAGSATLSWQAAEDSIGVTGYEVRRNGGAPVLVIPTQHSFAGLQAGAIDTFEVRARNGGGNLSLAGRLSTHAG
ncbi:fibronectin type III domain-containing protein [Pseudomonas fontis]|nr:fibronectin type III domain-containing protein [Pseudomonas fontis]